MSYDSPPLICLLFILLPLLFFLLPSSLLSSPFFDILTSPALCPPGGIYRAGEDIEEGGRKKGRRQKKEEKREKKREKRQKKGKLKEETDHCYAPDYISNERKHISRTNAKLEIMIEFICMVSHFLETL